MRALILGVLGQDGSYLAEQLADAGHDVWGMVRPRSYTRLGWIAPLVAGRRMRLVEGDLLDQASLEEALRRVRPDQVYNLAAVTAPGGGWGRPQPPLLAEATGLGVLHLLEAVRLRAPDAVLVHASSSAIHDPQRYGLYGAAKLFAHELVAGYREGHGLAASNAVLYSHTSTRQSDAFLARWVCRTVAAIAAGRQDRLALTNVDNRRDWGHAPDYAAALAAIGGQAEAGDRVVATGWSSSVKDLADAALDAAGLDWGVVDVLGGPAAAPEVFPDRVRWPDGWKPSTGFRDMVAGIVEHDLAAAR